MLPQTFCQPSQKPTCVLLTRPLEDSLKHQVQLQEQGIKSFISPLLTIVPWTLTPSEQAIINGAHVTGFILTSRHGLPALKAALEKEKGGPTLSKKQAPLFVVGQGTQQACLEAGFQNIRVADGSAKSLVSLLETSLSSQPASSSASLHSEHHLIYLRGKEIRLDLAQALPHLKITSVIAYKAQAATSLTQEAISALIHGEVTDVFFFSIRSAEVFMRLVNTAGLKDKLLSIRAHGMSRPILELLKSTEWQSKTIMSC